jgi:hypothetical protein
VSGGLTDALTDELTDAALLGESPKRRADKGAFRKPEICVRYPRTIDQPHRAMFDLPLIIPIGPVNKLNFYY